MVQEKRLVQQFFDLVTVDSESGNEAEISEVLKKRLAELGLSVTEDNAAEITGHGANNIFAALEATEDAKNQPTILFTCHMDTVTPGNGIKPRIDEDGYIRSDGTTILGSDDKAGIAALFEAIQVAKENKLSHANIQVVITVGEESGLLGARAIDPSMLTASYGYALDSNGDIGDIAVAAPTQAHIEIEIFGKSAHAGVSPEKGISAIQVAAKAVSAMKLGRIDEETTANIGRFEGGGPTNIVCDYVKLVAEARSIREDKLEAQVASMKQAVEETVESYQAKAVFQSNIVYPAYHHPDSSAVVQLACRAIRALNLEPRTFHSGGGSDANVFNGLGVPTVNLAVGYEHIHTTKEQIKVDNLIKTSQLVVELLKQSAQVQD
ncbi:M20/M25/M40 family metallo-hydrolase [Paenibacillus septentrionalis]|uniref:M20/M25/M40 family metallo-hydrolase n=1 Tax=Paenibacillus septentrionalis TaxID=429342 RepID=A0ABW1V4G8_9BACL